MAKRTNRSTKRPVLRLSRLVDTRVIYCGDNLDTLESLPSDSVDLIYIDPPFYTNRNYEVFWGEKWEERSFDDRHASIAGYLAFMRPRCQQLARVLKPTGSFYYHCDWHAGHYIKVMLDELLGVSCFVNEIVWKRQSSHNDARQGSKHLGRVHDTILLYKGSSQHPHTFNHLYGPYDPEYVEKHYRHVEPETGRRYSLGDITAPGGAAPSKGNPFYEFLGVRRYWRFSEERMHQLHAEGRILQSRPGAVPRQKRYLDEQPGVPLGSVWDDIKPVHGSSRERVGYPTQKPVGLLERIVQLSSNPGEIVLDAFCGCGTTIEAAEKLDRQWIGIDMSPTACHVMKKRIRDTCALKCDEALWKAGRGFWVRGMPMTMEKLEGMPPLEFENWAIIALNGIPNKTQTGDMGIDGRIYPVGNRETKGASGEQLIFTEDMFYPVQVKQKKKAGRPDIDAFETAMKRAGATKGFFVAFDYTKEAHREIRRFAKAEGMQIIPLTVEEILAEQEEERLSKIG